MYPVRFYSPVTCHAAVPKRCRVFRNVRGIIVDTESRMTATTANERARGHRRYPDWKSRAERSHAHARACIGGVCVRIFRDTDWQVFPGARENRSRNSRSPDRQAAMFRIPRTAIFARSLECNRECSFLRRAPVYNARRCPSPSAFDFWRSLDVAVTRAMQL